ncbi:MAG: hypothetical protein MJ002_00105 [Paludibacteraceae bacterium]|nr:hypothetical protein [Paludibacteraceae bacterium]
MTQQEILQLLVNPQKRLQWQIKVYRDNSQRRIHKIEMFSNPNFENSLDTMSIKQSNKTGIQEKDLQEIKSLLEEILRELKTQSCL